MIRKATSKTVLVSASVLVLCLVSGYLVVGVSGSQSDMSTASGEAILRGFSELVSRDASISELVDYVDANIAKLPAELATQMVLLLEKAQKEYLPELEEEYYAEDVQSDFAAGYVKGMDPNDLHLVSDGKRKELLVKTKAGGFRVETAEGMFWPVIDYEMYKKYSLLVSDDLSAYISIMAAESSQAPAKDAALVIGWNEIVRRVLAQEEFMRKYPDSQKLPEIKELFDRYVAFAFYGANNTPLFDYTAHSFNKDARIVFARVVEANRESDFAQAMGRFLTVAEENGFRLTEAVEAQREALVRELTNPN